MVVARASGMDLASILKRNTFLTLEVRPAGGPGVRGSARDGGTEKGPGTGGHKRAPGRGDTKGPPAVRGVGGVHPPRGGGTPYKKHRGGRPPYGRVVRN